MVDHHGCVERWATLARSMDATGLRLVFFEAGFNVLWRRAQLTLGDVTLAAVVNRVLYTTCERYPVLTPLTLTNAGINAGELAVPAENLDGQQLEEALRFVLLELLTVIGTLTADVLTPALHEALATVTAPDGNLPTDGLNVRNPVS